MELEFDAERLSRTLSHALRHAPRQYNLWLDDEGFAPLNDLFDALADRRSDWANLTIDHLHLLNERAGKQRYEITDRGIRAFYGHSKRIRLNRAPVEPPEYLYLGTTYGAYRNMERRGVQPMGKRYVHLSGKVEDAYRLAWRRTQNPVILLIDAKVAFDDGVGFYPGGPTVWLSDALHQDYLRKMERDEYEALIPTDLETFDDDGDYADGPGDQDAPRDSDRSTASEAGPSQPADDDF
jgi:putative RNA 2'-phosphotransferase